MLGADARSTPDVHRSVRASRAGTWLALAGLSFVLVLHLFMQFDDHPVPDEGAAAGMHAAAVADGPSSPHGGGMDSPSEGSSTSGMLAMCIAILAEGFVWLGLTDGKVALERSAPRSWRSTWAATSFIRLHPPWMRGPLVTQAVLLRR